LGNAGQKDNATYARGTLPTTGIPYVIVNGEVVVEDSQVLKVFPGQAIRFKEMSKGRFKPLSIEHWEKKYMKIPEGFYGLPKKEKTTSLEPKRTKGDWFARSSFNVPGDLFHGVMCPIHGNAQSIMPLKQTY
jgi:hypothetical protein